MFFPNTWGDGIIDEIEYNHKTLSNQKGHDGKIEATSGSFHFIFDSSDDTNNI